MKKLLATAAVMSFVLLGSANVAQAAVMFPTGDGNVNVTVIYQDSEVYAIDWKELRTIIISWCSGSDINYDDFTLEELLEEGLSKIKDRHSEQDDLKILHIVQAFEWNCTAFYFQYTATNITRE